MATEDDKVDIGKIFTIGVVVVTITFAIVIVAQFAYFQIGEADFRRKNDAPPRALQSYMERQQTQLAGYTWENKEQKTVTIPIDRAIALTAESGGSLPVIEAVEVEEVDTSPAELGQGLYTTLGCIACHSLTGERIVGPSFKGIWGEEHKFTDGSATVVNAEYVKNSILYPQQQIVETYQGVMPAYEGRVSEEDLEHLVAFIESLGS